MKKSFKYYAVVWAIFLALFNLVCFITPNEVAGITKFSNAFWVGYIFIMLAFVGQLVCAFFAFKADNLQKLFYNIPLITVSYTGLVLSVIFGGLCMVIPDLPNWLGAAVCATILAFMAVSVIKASAAGETVATIDEKVKAKTYFIKSLTADAESLMAQAKTPKLRAQAKRVYEAIHYSDPMSNAALVEMEEQLGREFEHFAELVRVGDDAAAENVVAELLVTIDRRNKKCKVLK